MSFAMRARTALALGPRNVARALAYRLALRAGLHPVQRLASAAPSGPFFRTAATISPLSPRHEWQAGMLAFGHLHVATDAAPPHWLADVTDGSVQDYGDRPWWKIPDFGAVDIKTVWELSRFDWVIAFAQMAAAGKREPLDRLNAWLDDWLATNRPGHGPNWKCGQEASIRLIHLAAAAVILDQVERPEPALVELTRLHLRRIAPTLSYALSQDNNHGTSEAVALFVGGTWLERLGEPEGRALAALGRRTIEERVGRLVSAEGTFSQYSVTYHRMMLDSISFAELWRRRMDAPSFGERFNARAAAAARWLQAATDEGTGDAPNTGANDGTRILRLSDEPYRDFRGAVQLATALFTGRRAYAEPIPGDHALAWLGVALPETVAPQPDRLLDEEGGFAMARRGEAMALLRFPRFRFRPSHADALHVDYWHAGRNLLRDAGTYGYHSGEEALLAFAGVAGHNTAQFDDHDQMPRLGRFLYGSWIPRGRFECAEIEAGTRLEADYRDRWGCRHARTVELFDDSLRVTDRLAGFEKRAVVRWHLPPGEARVSEDMLIARDVTLRISANGPFTLRLIEGRESRHYLHMEAAPVLEIMADGPLEITTLAVPAQ